MKVGELVKMGMRVEQAIMHGVDEGLQSSLNMFAG